MPCSGAIHAEDRIDVRAQRRRQARGLRAGLGAVSRPRSDGFSVVDAAGQRTDKERGLVVREPSKIVIIVARGGAETERRIAAIGGAYKTQFHQQSVGVVTRPVCASF
jgi:Protein of unknown function (DUF3574)